MLGSWLKRYNSDRNKLWKELLDFKYEIEKPNIFLGRTSNSSSFFKGFIWAAQAVKIGFRWKVGNGKKIRLWEDTGSTSLAIQFWALYIIINEHGKSIANLWDGITLECSFGRNVNEALYQLEVIELVSTIQFSEDEDEMIWQFTGG